MQFTTLSRSQRFATVVSIVCVPPTFSFIAFLLLTAFFEEGTAAHKFAVAFVAICFSSIFPIIYVMYLQKERVITGYDVPIREQRTNPYIMSVMNASFGFFLLLFMHASVYVWALMWCYAANTLILLLINRYWKVSAHMMGLTGPMIMLSVIFEWHVLLALPILILIGWSRVVLNIHSIGQVVAGACLGAVLTTFQLYLIFNYGVEILRFI